MVTDKLQGTVSVNKGLAIFFALTVFIFLLMGAVGFGIGLGSHLSAGNSSEEVIVIINDDNSTPTEPETATPTPTPTATPTPEPTLTELRSITTFNLESLGDVQDFTGNGESVTKSFKTGGMLTHFIYEYEKDPEFSSFSVWLIDADTGDKVDLVANELDGNGSGVFPAAIPEGEYILDVDADGDWNITVATPSVGSDDIQELPVAANGTGRDVVGVVELDGNTIVSGEHSGDSNFGVWIYNEDATSILDAELVFNELGEFEGETHIDAEGTVWVAVNANGEWNLEFE